MAGAERRWIGNVTGFTLAGLISSSLVGAAIGAVPLIVASNVVRAAALILTLVVASLVVGQALPTSRVPLPQPARQTNGGWACRFGGPKAAVLWGFDLGFVFTTWLTFPSPWMLVPAALLSGTPAWGAGIFAAYWGGRALSVWIAPLLVLDANEPPRLMVAIQRHRLLFWRVQFLGVAALMVLLALQLRSG